ncbi:hypothetical protein GCM10009678_49860 [Actinomadura kijaniata]|uniref:DUF8094 domain-containing protein n=1 Tax=Actinomadura namibiensis TaxID=182080 RepID=A0A7W3QM14_ACTNM|nr:hypothetical protein [Actinomadura namibiensis]MBA8951538.1 hypothetical protein [Actinomadura namibiensis]
MHRRTLAAAVLVALVPLGTVTAACADRKPEARPSPLPTFTPAPEPLTPKVAEREFRAHVANDDVARAAGDERLALAWATDGQAQLTAAEYRRAAFDGDPVKRYEYDRPKLYVPRIGVEKYPQWFVAETTRRERGKDGGGTVYMAFTKRSVSDRWKLSLVTEPKPRTKLPKVPVDAEGYAAAMFTTDTSVLIRPREVPGIQATLATEGPGSIAALVMETGWSTTEYHQRARKAERKARSKELRLQTVMVATPFPIFSLRAEHGDSLVLYSLSRNSSYTVRNPRDRTAKPPIPSEVEHLLDGTVKGNELHTSETLQFAALDPLKVKKGEEQRKARVLARSGTFARATTPPLKN